MKISVKSLNENFRMEATNETGNFIHMDAGPAAGGEGSAPRPMEVVIMALGGCSTIDVLSILRKARQPVSQIEVQINAEREKDKVPALFTTIHAHFIIKGAVDEVQGKRAVDLSLQKYCSVAKTLEKSAEITWSYEIVWENG